MSFRELIDELIEAGYLKTPGIIEAFRRVNRRDFLPPALQADAAWNSPLPIGHRQTISQPLTVAFMLELLAPQSGDRVLDVGAGSGWTTALLAEIVGPSGGVYAVERIAELKNFGQQNVGKYNFSNVTFFCRDGHRGLPDHAPFDRILVSAAARRVPPALRQQLANNGRMVIPTTDEDIRLIKKSASGTFKETRYPGFIFVPLVEE